MKNLVKFVVIISFCGLYSNLIAQNIFEEKQKEYIIKNKVKSQTSYDYYYTNDKLSKEGIKTSQIFYDKNGNVIEVITYKKNDTLSREFIQYDEDGKKIDYKKIQGSGIAYHKKYEYKGNDVIREYGFDGTNNFEIKYSYFSPGKLKEILYYTDKKLVEKRTFTHNKNLSEITIEKPIGRISSYINLIYDNQGNIVEEKLLNEQKQVIETKKYTYNKNLLSSETKIRNNNIISKTFYNYSQNNDLIEIWEENAGEAKFLRKRFTYDDKGNLIKMEWRRNGNEPFSERTYTYNNQNLCTEYLTYYPVTKFKVLTKFVYE